MGKSFVVIFGGVPGTSKTPVAYYLSWEFSLPIFSHDAIRNEVKEDLLVDDINAPEALKEFEKRAAERREQLLGSGKPVIFDSSVDRKWATQKEQLESRGYSWYLINFELSKPFIENLYKAKDYNLDVLDHYLGQHKEFMDEHASDVSLEINDGNFSERLSLADSRVRKFIDSLK